MNKKNLALSLSTLLFLISGCKSNPNKVTDLESPVKQTEIVSAQESIGVNADGMMVYQRKVRLAEELRRLQNEVSDLEDHLWGTRAYKTTGLIGQYQSCRNKLPKTEQSNFSAYSAGTRPSESIEDAANFKAGVDTQKDKLALITEEKIADRILRLKTTRQQLQSKEDELIEKLNACRAVNSP
jgi:hypothetical protein